MMKEREGNLRTLGVLGGMGVEATIAFMQRVHAKTLATDDSDHVPMIVALNPQVPSRIRHLIEKSGPNPGPVLGDMAAMLENAGAQALVMPCNTAHHYAQNILDRVGIPLLNMPELACARIAQSLPSKASVGILASPATNSTGLFDAMLAQVGLQALFPDDEAPLLALIRSIKKCGPQPGDATLLQTESEKLVQRGASAILVGCSEFSLLSDAISPTVPLLDTLDVIVDASIAFAGALHK